MIEFTQGAIETLKKRAKEGDFVRIAVKGGGCSGFLYDMEIESAPSDGDIVLEFQDIRVCLDRQSSFMLSDTVVDYEETLAQSGFKFINGQATRSCGCGQSFSS